MEDFEKRVREISQQIHDENSTSDQFAVSQTPYHTHNGSDSPVIDFSNIKNRLFIINFNLPGSQGQTANNWGVIFTAPFPCAVLGATEIHQTAETTSTTMTAQIEKLTGTTASGSGTQLLFALPGITGVSVQSGGSGYAVNDTITLTGGTASTNAILKVLTISGSAVATVSIQNAGNYTAFPANPVSQGSTSGGGSGATFNITYVVPGFNLKATASTLQTAMLNTTSLKTNTNAFNLLTGDRLGLVLTTSGSSPATLIGVNINIQLHF